MSDVGDDIRAAQAELSGGHPLGKPVEPAPAPAASPAETPATGAPTTDSAPTGRARDENGRFTKGEAAGEHAPTTVEGETEQAKAASPTPAAPTKRPPPQSWRPSARDAWDKVPPEAQEEIERVERTTKQLVQRDAQVRKQGEAWDKVVAAYRPYIQGEPTQYVEGLLRTATQLQTAPAPQRAALVAQIVRDFGVDINALDEALSQAPAPRQQEQRREEYKDPRVDQILLHLQRMQWAPKVEDFEKEAKYLDEPMPAEFGSDILVRNVVGAILASAGQHGIAMTLQQAYDAAIALHPTLREAQKQAADAKAAAERNTQTAAARAASSSIRSEPVVVAAEEPSGGSARDDVRASLRMLRGR